MTKGSIYHATLSSRLELHSVSGSGKYDSGPVVSFPFPSQPHTFGHGNENRNARIAMGAGDIEATGWMLYYRLLSLL